MVDYYGYELEPRYVDINGREVERTPFSNPYNYDEFVLWKSDKFNSHTDSGVYSDRMMQWDLEKYNKCCREVFQNEGQMFGNRKPKQIEKFLSKYLGEDILLTAIIQGCHWITGFPYCAFYYRKI